MGRSTHLGYEKEVVSQVCRSPHIHPLPTHNTYSLFLVPKRFDLPTYTPCVQCQPTVSAICDVIFLRDSGNHRCELWIVNVATRPRHCTSPLNKYLYVFFFVSASCSSFSNRLSPSHSTITRRRPPHVLWYHISYEITASIVTLDLAGYIPPPYKILFLDSRPGQNKVWIVGIVVM